MSNPTNWPPELIRELQVAALELAIYPPARFSRIGYMANVSRADIARLRLVFSKAGIDWRKLKREQMALDRAARQLRATEVRT